MTRALLALVAMAAGCAAPEVGASTSAVHAGTPSELTVAFVTGAGDLASCVGTGVALTSRHVLVATPCIDEGVINVGIPSGEDSHRFPIVEVHRAAAPVTTPGGEVFPAILVTASELPLDGLALGEAAPALGDELRLIGFGPLTTRELRVSEGAVRVTSVDGSRFVVEGVDDVRGCDADAPVLDATGGLVGFALYGPRDPRVVGCFAESTCVEVVSLGSWVDATVSLAVPDPQPGPIPDVGPAVADASAAVDAGGPDASVGADAGATGEAGGCAVTPSEGPTGWLVALLLGLALRLRRARLAPLAVLLALGCGGGGGVDAGPPPIDAGAAALDAGSDAGRLVGAGLGDCTSEAEAALQALIDEARATEGVGGVTCDPALAAVAQAHADDMCENDYFDQTSLDGRTPFDRLDDAGVGYEAADQAIALGQRTAEQVHESLLGSMGTRAIVLDGRWARVGIGVAPCDGRPRWVETFAD